MNAGRLLVKDPWKAEDHPVRAAGSREPAAMDVVDPYTLEVEDLSRAIRTGGEPLLGRDDAVSQARVLEALYAGCGVSLTPPTRCLGAVRERPALRGSPNGRAEHA